ncbi:hypothetical protein FNV43_RR21744 [Rhamnella rubrinervis]|uniref:Uncharacterized protein n=1 Tax=Rhamnella rubrinervis TaxID=2594499 RepID=A0A8K0DV74_9ROSA|nr:hypothetical protein FNV43_RR21744 [Rhamnella rubrinervis]
MTFEEINHETEQCAFKEDGDDSSEISSGEDEAEGGEKNPKSNEAELPTDILSASEKTPSCTRDSFDEAMEVVRFERAGLSINAEEVTYATEVN